MWALRRPLILGTNMLVGNGIRLRQLRIKPEPCERKGPKGFEEITKARPPAPTHTRRAHTHAQRILAAACMVPHTCCSPHGLHECCCALTNERSVRERPHEL